MQTFSKRNNLRKEYSGFEEASIQLRNRLLQLYGHPYSGNEFSFGVGNTNWIHEVAFDKDLQMHFGTKMPIESFREKILTSYNDVFDFIELYFLRAKKDLDYNKRDRLYNISTAFINSNSVYEFNEVGQVALKIDEETAKNITATDEILEPYKEAQDLYRDSIDGLITRLKQPKDIVGDVYITFEEYSKKVTGKASLEKAIQYFREILHFHTTQLQIIEKLKAYRGDVWGPAHAGNSSKPDESDALWYLESLIAQISYIDRKIKSIQKTIKE